MYSTNKHADKAPASLEKHIHWLFILLLLFLNTSEMAMAQYVHPNQPGRKGGDTGPGIGEQVVGSTYLGNAGNPLGQGTIYSVNKDGKNYATFHTFLGYPSDGSYPFYTTPFQASDQSLYGTSYLGGTGGLGAIYKMNVGGNGTCGESLIYSNTVGGGSGGGNFANVNELSDGKLYYPATYGGANALGAIYSMNKDGSNVTLLHTFNYTLSQPPHTAAGTTSLGAFTGYDGAYPYGFVVEGPDGKVYGTTFAGGGKTFGIIYRMDKDGSNYEIIHDAGLLSSSHKDGSGATLPFSYAPYASWGNVAIDQTGKVYYTGYYGGVNNLGGVIRMNADGSNPQIILSGSLANGTYPYRGALIVDDKVYGTFRTNGGGTSIGVVYRMNLDGTGYTKLKTFESPYTDGTDLWAGLIYDGNFLYGTTLTNGGLGSVGTVFKVKTDGTGFQTLHSFKNTASVGCNGKPGNYSYFPSSERLTLANVNLNCSITCIEDPGCYAGTTAPTISGNTIANTCPANTVDLTSLVTGTCPTGSLAKWFTSSTPSATNMVADAANATAGTYYVACADAVNNCYSSASGAVTATINGCVNGTIDCSKTQIYTAPVVGQAAQKTLLVTINVTSAGCFSPITVSGSGMTVPAGFNQICTTTTGIQQFSIPVNYSGAALGTMNFTIGSATNAGSCSADLTNTPKKAISDVWTLDCVPTTGPSLK